MDAVGEGFTETQSSIRRVHHEFKNNLQTICSLIRLYSTTLDSEGRRILRRIEGCVHSMGSMYESLDKTGSDFSRVPIHHYLLTILQKALKSVDCEEVGSRVPLKYSTLCVESRIACQLGLLFNELIVNTLSGCPENKRVERALLDINIRDSLIQIKVDFRDLAFTRPESKNVSEEKILNALAAQVEAVIMWPWESDTSAVSLLIPKSILAVSNQNSQC